MTKKKKIGGKKCEDSSKITLEEWERLSPGKQLEMLDNLLIPTIEELRRIEVRVNDIENAEAADN